MNDIVINAINNKFLNQANLNFYSLRSLAGIDSNAWDQLGRGRNILNQQHQLNQYLFSYGPMVSNQWRTVLPNATSMFAELESLENNAINVFDYGCGQGLATLLFLDVINPTRHTRVQQLTLVEPSQIALSRATKILNCRLADTNINSINKKMDDISSDELKITESQTNVHLFSNILDIEGFDEYKLFNNILKHKGTHHLVAVSNDRNWYGGSQRLTSLYEAVLHEAKKGKFKVSHQKTDCFTNERGQKSIYFCLKVEVL